MVVRWDEGVRERVKRGLKITIGSYRINETTSIQTGRKGTDMEWTGPRDGTRAGFLSTCGG